MKKDFNWGSIIPLLGGMSIGNYEATNEVFGKHILPSVFWSYKAFASNDSHCIAYFNDVLGADAPYIVLDGDEHYDEKLPKINLISAVPPCAGLSQLNCGGSKNADKKRGACAIQNEWMYRSSNFILGTIKPDVLMGENAPALFTLTGQGVRENLMNIAIEHGYSLTFYKTSTSMHGIPQNRIRTFYFFWKGERAPIMGWYERDKKTVSEYLKEIPTDAPHTDVYFNTLSLKDVPEYQYIVDRYGKDWRKTTGPLKTIYNWLDKEGKLDDALQWAEENGKEKMIKILNHINNKKKMGKGYWDSSPCIIGDTMNAAVGRNLANSTHPDEERYFNIREFMHIMGLPHDFKLQNKHFNQIAQNVPVNTARDVTIEAIKFINGELELSNNRFIMQDNLKQKITIMD